MSWCFVHAPNENGWNGELLLAFETKSRNVRLRDIERLIEKLYPNDDCQAFHYDNDVAEDRVKEFKERKEHGILQRRSTAGSYEDMHYDEWIKGMSRHYIHLAKFAQFILPTILGLKSVK